MSWITSILDQGVTIITLADERLYNSKSLIKNPLDLMHAFLVLVRAFEESRTKGERIEKAWQGRRDALKKSRKIYTKKVPLWLKVKGNKIIEVPERVEIVRQIFDMYLGGNGFVLIAKKLNEQGVPPFKSAKWWG